jgi:dolichol-phosphate mannosyltransferase
LKVVVVLPTYNEAENIGRLIHALQAPFARTGHDCAILVVDDRSPDGTAGIVREAQRRHSNVHLLEGERRGLGAAYIRGMRHALRELKADVVFEMDADFSHDPDDVPRLLQALEGGADFVIGSRYVEGGSIPAEWAWQRRAISRWGNRFARHIAGLHGVRDCTAGFRAIRGNLLRDIDLEHLRVQGYAFQIALLYEARLQGARIVEVPVHFIDRSAGESKLGWRDLLEFGVNVWWLRLRSSATFGKFLVVGGSGVVVNLGVFTLLLNAGVGKFIASPIAIEVSVVSNFLLNNYWTFRERKSTQRVRVKGLKFNVVSLLALALSYGTFVALSHAFPAWPPQLSQFLGIVPATVVNYVLNSYWTFQKVAPTEPRRRHRRHR